MKIKNIKNFFKKTENFLKKNNDNALLGIPYLNPHFPRSINYERKKINFRIGLLQNLKKFLDRFINFREDINFYKKNNFKHLVVSHLVSIDQVDYLNDFYYGDLGKRLGKDNTLFVLIDHIGFEKKKVKKKFNGNFIILSKYLSPSIELKLFLLTTIKVLVYDLFRTDLKIFSLKNILSSIENQRISIQIFKISKKFNFRNIFLTFEGNPYEKIICNKLKKTNQKILIFGYQFGVIRKLQHSLYFDIGKNFYPNIIFTIGEYNKKILQSKFKTRLKIINTGSFKKNKIYTPTKIKNKNKNKIQILVMPEGIMEEIKIFEKYCSKNITDDVVFNFRLHPIFSKNKKLIKFLTSKNPRIKISTNSINNDYRNNNFLLYRGSAAVINAVNNGLIPIYLKCKNEVSVDPLHHVNKLHLVSINDNLLSLINKLREKKYLSEFNKTKKFVKFFYDKPKFSSLKDLI